LAAQEVEPALSAAFGGEDECPIVGGTLDMYRQDDVLRLPVLAAHTDEFGAVVYQRQRLLPHLRCAAAANRSPTTCLRIVDDQAS